MSRLKIPGADFPEWPADAPEHADLHWLSPPEDKHTIGVDAVRSLVGELAMTSYEGGSKVAIVEPADAMTGSAANGLLKTLEEPPGDSLIILIADRSSHLPATILSRCQRIRVNCPPVGEALDWLQSHRSHPDWMLALEAAGGAPLKAVDAMDRLDEIAAMTREFCEVASGATSPLAVAAGWAKMEPRGVLDWLSAEVQKAIRAASEGPHVAAGPVAAESVRQHMDRRNLFCYLDTINRLRAQAAGSFNVQLTFESLLIDWSRGLNGVARRNSMQFARLPGMGR